MTMLSLTSYLYIWSALQALSSATTINSALPIIDLGYSKYQATSYNETSKAYTFRNIRFAAPPLGERRFAAPQPPLYNRTLQTGSYGAICYQALPLWVLAARGSSLAQLESTDAGGEDCLFLDVVVPKTVFDNSSSNKTEAKAPVLVWIVGGGYVAGAKDTVSANGLIEKSDDRAIFVAMNYRLGAFGWMSGPSFQASGGVPNLGLYDQRFALEWIQKHISQFGGDKKQVTIMGESAGGGSVLLQVTAYGGAGGNGSLPFKQAIPQSPGFDPIVNHYEQEETYVEFLKKVGCLPFDVSDLVGLGLVDGGLECLRNVSTKALQKANLATVSVAPYGRFAYGPVVDGLFVPDLPGLLLAQGHYDHNLSLMIGHNADEGFLFTDPAIANETTFNSYLTHVLPSANRKVIKYITSALYPPPSNYTPYTTNFARAALLVSELVFTCNTIYLAHAFGNNTYNYVFSVPPAYHGEDVAYTFYDPDSGLSDTAAGVANATVASRLQSYIMNFVVNGQPNEKGVPYFPIFGDQSRVASLNISSITEFIAPAANARCTWWQKALYF